jgi:hypothetical protein
MEHQFGKNHLFVAVVRPLCGRNHRSEMTIGENNQRGMTLG